MVGYSRAEAELSASRNHQKRGGAARVGFDDCRERNRLVWLPVAGYTAARTADRRSKLRRSARSIFVFWVPMAATWLMMSLEGPFLAAVIARLPDPKFNLAAYGVAFAFAILVEAPVIMIMSASTALVEDSTGYYRLRRFTYLLNAGITALMVLLLASPIFDLIMLDLIDLPPEVARLTRVSLIILLPWPAAIGYRRFFQGLLIRSGLTRLVAAGTVIRLIAMAATALTLYLAFSVSGAYVGAAALAAGVCAEAVASRVMAAETVRELLERGPQESEEGPLDYRRIIGFYYPLALTSVLGLAVHPMVTFFMGQARFPVESLAVLPVVNSLSFIFRSMGLSYQEVAIALLGKRHEHFPELARFALILGLVASVALALVGFTPLSHVWFVVISGLSEELTAFAITPTRILAALPGLSVLLAFQRAVLMQGRVTRPITVATAIEVVGIVLILLLLIRWVDMVGVTAAAVAYVAGRLGSTGYLIPSSLRVLRRSRVADE